MANKITISGKAHITIKHNEVKECILGDKLYYLILEELVGLNKTAPKSAIVYVSEHPESYYSTPSVVLFPDSDYEAPFHIPNQSVDIRLELDTSEFTAEELLKIEMVLSVIAKA